jgi:hypothetical protein
VSWPTGSPNSWPAAEPERHRLRPAVALAVETVVDTDTFRSIFRTAIRRTHEALLRAVRLDRPDLSDSFAIVTASLQAPSARRARAAGWARAWPT